MDLCYTILHTCSNRLHGIQIHRRRPQTPRNTTNFTTNNIHRWNHLHRPRNTPTPKPKPIHTTTFLNFIYGVPKRISSFDAEFEQPEVCVCVLLMFQ